MTTTPTLYVEEKVSIGEAYYDVRHRPATHDELIAAMPRCGTCGEWKEGKYNKGTCFNIDAMPVETAKDFGCTEHKERV